jgi:hypothetical protein
VPDPNHLLSLTTFAYAGPGAGLELVPYALGLLGWIGVALGAVLLAPVSALARRLRALVRKNYVGDEPPPGVTR